MIIIPRRGRRLRGPRQRAAAVVAAAAARVAAFASGARRTGRGFPRSSFPGADSGLLWVLGGLAVAVVAAVVVLVIVRANEDSDAHGDSAEADDPHADDERAEGERRRKLIAIVVAIALAAAVFGLALYQKAGRPSRSPTLEFPSTTAPRP